ncbi:MAG: hypothetical protein LCH89_00065 [Proteobacteria bacterium]|jgi:hypothetical protein|nr:hypothetical protein [Pseudomonadota bacterium]
MLQRINSPEFVHSEIALAHATPQARPLIQALLDCCHPRAGRLVSRLCDCQAEAELASLRAEVRNLLALSFGTEEAKRRLELQ